MVSIFESPENRNLKFNKRQLKGWIIEYNPKITQDYLEYISDRVMITLWMYKIKREHPEKYKIILEKKRRYSKEHPEMNRIIAKRRYEKIKNNPILLQRMHEMQKTYLAKKRLEPDYKQKQAEWQKKYYKKMKIENPEKYYLMQQMHKRPSKYITGVKCPNCGNPIKTITSGHLGKRPIQCPKCRFAYPKKECERIKIPRILPETRKKTEEINQPPDKMILPEEVMKGLRNFGMIFAHEMEEPREIVGNEKKVAENIKKKMIKYIDWKEMIR
jgi:predicted RNA-binding Zn-ribbon protein involved in translation (DUF1610 family)